MHAWAFVLPHRGLDSHEMVRADGVLTGWVRS
jgi:hypothetical protein